MSHIDELEVKKGRGGGRGVGRECKRQEGIKGINV